MQEDPKRAGTEAGPPVPPGYYYGMKVEEDEINLLDLFIVLLKHKGMIFSIVILAGLLSVLISLNMPNIYRSQCTIAPTTQEKMGGALASLGGFGALIASEVGIGASGSVDQFEVVLKSRELTSTIVRRYNLMPVLFEKQWDAANKRWKPDVEPPEFEDAFKVIQQNLLKVTPDRKQNVVRLSFEAKDPRVARRILNYYVDGLSEFLRRQTVEDAAAQRVQLIQQLARTTDPLLKNRLYELIAKQIEKETLANVQKYFSFNVIDPAFVPEKKFKPRRMIISILSVVVAFFIAIFLAFFLEYVHNLKTQEDPERLARLRKYSRLWNS